MRIMDGLNQISVIKLQSFTASLLEPLTAALKSAMRVMFAQDAHNGWLESDICH